MGNAYILGGQVRDVKDDLGGQRADNDLDKKSVDGIAGHTSIHLDSYPTRESLTTSNRSRSDRETAKWNITFKILVTELPLTDLVLLSMEQEDLTLCVNT